MSKHRRQNDGGDERSFTLLPYNMRKLVEAVGFPKFENMDEDEARIYELARSGRCMTCEATLGENANVIISRYGIVGAYCSGVCHSDMAIMGYLQEQHGDLVQKVDFRKEQGRIDRNEGEKGDEYNVGLEEIEDATEVPDSLGDDAATRPDDSIDDVG